MQGVLWLLSPQSTPYDRQQPSRTISRMVDEQRNEIPKFIRRVMPHASEAELREATANFDNYMAVVWKIFQRIRREQADSDSQKSGVCDRFDDIDQSV
jgi:hypothetical protein